MDPQPVIGDIRRELRRLLGQKLQRSRKFFATRHFYFAEPGRVVGGGGSHFTLGLECAWRIQTREQIIVGSEDYYEPADQNTDPNWDPEMPGGHLQDQKLVELMGELADGDIINRGRDLVVTSVDADVYGGLEIGLTGGYSLVACRGEFVSMAAPDDGHQRISN
jgi:hypothetical protein